MNSGFEEQEPYIQSHRTQSKEHKLIQENGTGQKDDKILKLNLGEKLANWPISSLSSRHHPSEVYRHVHTCPCLPRCKAQLPPHYLLLCFPRSASRA